MSIDTAIAGMIRTEVAKALRQVADAIDASEISLAVSRWQLGAPAVNPFPTVTAKTPIADKPKRPRKANTSTKAVPMIDGAGTRYAGRGRKPAGFDDSTARPANGSA